MTPTPPTVSVRLCGACQDAARQDNTRYPRYHAGALHAGLRRIGAPKEYESGPRWGYLIRWRCMWCQTIWEHDDERTVGRKEHYWVLVKTVAP